MNETNSKKIDNKMPTIIAIDLNASNGVIPIIDKVVMLK